MRFSAISAIMKLFLRSFCVITLYMYISFNTSCMCIPGIEQINPSHYVTTTHDVNMALFSPTFKIAKVASIEECLEKCSAEAKASPDNCRSVNFEMQKKPNRICELNSHTKSSKPDLFLEKSGFIYYEMFN